MVCTIYFVKQDAIWKLEQLHATNEKIDAMQIDQSKKLLEKHKMS